MITIIATGVRAKLIADATISAAVGTRVYLVQAAENATLPYIVVTWVGGGSTNDTPRDAIDVQVQVDAISDAGATALTLEKAIRDALHEQALTLASPWNWQDSEHLDPFYFVEPVDRRFYHHAGGTYRIRATE